MTLKHPIGFYVYHLIDPRNGQTFYIGKGQGRRAWQHEISVLSGGAKSTPRKVERIKALQKFRVSKG